MVGLPPKQTFTSMKNALGDAWTSSNFTICTAEERSLERVKAYCNDANKPSADKETQMFSYGTFPSGKPGRPKLESFLDVIQQYDSVADLALSGEIPLGILNNSLKLVQELQAAKLQKPRALDKIRVIVIQGAPGTGKTQYVKFFHKDAVQWQVGNGASATWASVRVAKADKLWLEEFYGQGLTPEQLLRLCDSGEFTYRLPGGTEVQFQASTIVITTNAHPRDWYAGLKEKHTAAWQRWYEAFMSRCCTPGAPRPDDVHNANWRNRGWGEWPDYQKAVSDEFAKQATEARDAALLARLTQQGGLRIVGPSRRITPQRAESV